MPNLFRTALPALIVAPLALSAQPLPDAEAIARMQADVRFLASDSLEGREAGTAGERKAADHVAAQFAAIGLKPLGDSGILHLIGTGDAELYAADFSGNVSDPVACLVPAPPK